MFETKTEFSSTFQVCSIQSEFVCRDQETKSCDLVQDVLCRNVTETRWVNNKQKEYEMDGSKPTNVQI